MRQVLLNYYEAENKMLGKLQQTQYNFTSNVNDKVTTASSVLIKLLTIISSLNKKNLL